MRLKSPFALAVTTGTVAVVALLAVPLASTRTDAPAAAAKSVDARLASIPVEGMVCLSCVATIKQKLKAIPGVQDAEVRLAQKVVILNYRADQPDVPTKAAAAIDDLGYKAGKPMVGA